MALHSSIQEVIDRETGRHSLANNHLKGVIDLLENNSDVITPEVFSNLMVSTAEALNLEHADRIKDLKTVLKLRELISAYLSDAPANGAAAPEETKATSNIMDLGDPLPASTQTSTFSLGDPLDEPEEADEPAAEEPQPAIKKLSTVNKSSVLTKVKPETEQVTAPAAVQTEVRPVLDTSTLIEIPETEAEAEVETTETPQETGSVSITMLPEETPVRKRRGRQPGTKVTPKAISDVDAVVGQLVDHIQNLQREIATLKAENESLRQEAHTSKVSLLTRKKLEALGINI
jgi:hypothetical protein